MKSGMIFDIQRMCVHDGPGIRTTVFLKGCPMRCFWCHNPESIHQSQQLMVYADKCIHCGSCVTICPQKAHSFKNGRHTFDRSRCINCCQCAKYCDAKALVISGIDMKVDEVMTEILKDSYFYKSSKGGVTFSGGEPLLQIDFLEQLLIECKKNNIHTAIETAGNVCWKNIDRIVNYTDLFLYDIKLINETSHIQVTGSSNKQCLSNLQQLINLNANVRVRIPVIPSVNDSEKTITEIVSLIRSLNKNIEIELMPFHKMGKSKYESLGLAYQASELQPPSKETMHLLNTILGG